MKHFLTVLFVLMISTSFGTDWYICDAATGADDGSDWTNAFETWPPEAWFSGTAARGDILWLADTDGTSIGVPNQSTWFDLNLAASGTTSFTICKATTASHGSETGWSNSFGDGQAIVSGCFQSDSDYIHIDGVVGSGDGPTAYGIVFRPPADSDMADGRALINVRYNVRTHWHIEHCEFDGMNEGPGPGIEQVKFCGLSASGINFTIENCYIHHFPWVCLEIDLVDSYLQDCVITNRRGGEKIGSEGYIHGALMTVNPGTTTANFHVRRNVWEDCNGTAFIESTNTIHDPHGEVYIYNNIFRQGETTRSLTNASIAVTNGCVVENYLLYGNTFWFVNGHPESSAGVGIYGSDATNEIKNNLFINMDLDAVYGAGETFGYNAHYNCSNIPSGSNQQTLGSDPCPGAPSDMTLDFATNSGLTLNSPFNEDLTGAMRGADAIWDRGAYEFDSASPEPEAAGHVLFWMGGMYFYE